MGEARLAELPRRGVVSVGGPEATAFLNNLITSDIERARRDGAVYGGLLTPQGKILFDFIVLADRDGFLFDIARPLIPDFLKRLALYRLRAKVEIADRSDERIVVAAWGSDRPPVVDGPVAADPRLPGLGWRAIVPAGADMAADFTEATEAAYDAHRIAFGIPEGGVDFPFGDVFPHDADMDQLGGIDFGKGCYVGQEVVSRMEHRGTARRRIVIARGEALPEPGTPISAGGRPIGALGSSVNGVATALVRFDRAKEAIDAGIPILAGEAPVALALPSWARFGWTVEPSEAS